MVYHNKLVTAVKVNGKILREYGEMVYIPFGSEYSILFKNLNSVRVKVKVSVDGTDATDGTSLVIRPNTTLELERFIRNGNWSSGNKFKFIERTGEIEGHRGIKADDGLIRVEYHTERVMKQTITYTQPQTWPWVERRSPCPWQKYPERRWDRRGASRQSAMNLQRSLHPSASSGQASVFMAGSPQAFNYVATETSSSGFAGASAALNDAGITVPGSESLQQFHFVEDFPTEPGSDVVVLRLRGKMGDDPVTQPRTVDIKPKCETCGKVNSGVNKFCSNCGTALVTY